MQITANPLSSKAFENYGTVIQKAGSDSYQINNGNCTRHHSLAIAETKGSGAQVIINIFDGMPYALPLKVSMVERHPLGSQAFFPLGNHPWLVVVCRDLGGGPVDPEAFLASPDQGINLSRNVWHGVLTPLFERSDFLVVDRGGEGDNLEEFHFEPSDCFEVTVPNSLL